MKLTEVKYDAPAIFVVIAEMYKEDPEAIGPFSSEQEAGKYIQLIEKNIDWYDFSIHRLDAPQEFIERNTGELP